MEHGGRKDRLSDAAWQADANSGVLVSWLICVVGLLMSRCFIPRTAASRLDAFARECAAARHSRRPTLHYALRLEARANTFG